jgi:hypothetical protein
MNHHHESPPYILLATAFTIYGPPPTHGSPPYILLATAFTIYGPPPTHGSPPYILLAANPRSQFAANPRRQFAANPRRQFPVNPRRQFAANPRHGRTSSLHSVTSPANCYPPLWGRGGPSIAAGRSLCLPLRWGRRRASRAG